MPDKGNNPLRRWERHRFLGLGFWLLALVGLLAGWQAKRLRPALKFGVGFWLFSFLGTAAGLYFRGHYFILLLPAFAVVLGLAVEAWREIMPAKFLADVCRSLPVMAFGLSLAWAVFYNAQIFFEWPVGAVCQPLYRQNPFAEAIAAARLIEEHSTTAARVAVIGSEPEIYFCAHRHSATGYIYTYPLMEAQPYALVMQQEMVREIESVQPEFLVQVPFVLSWLPQPGSSHYLTDWFSDYAAKFYDPVGIVGSLSSGKFATAWGPGAVPPRTRPGLEVNPLGFTSAGPTPTTTRPERNRGGHNAGEWMAGHSNPFTARYRQNHDADGGQAGAPHQNR